MSFAPRVMISSADLPGRHPAEFLQPASRITYRLAVASALDAGRAGEQAAQRYLQWARAGQEPAWRAH